MRIKYNVVREKEVVTAVCKGIREAIYIEDKMMSELANYRRMMGSEVVTVNQRKVIKRWARKMAKVFKNEG